jgi:phosphomannomutase
VLDLGLSGTEEMYFATTHLGAGGGICVTDSHNPMDYNGIKTVSRAPRRWMQTQGSRTSRR